MTHAERMVVLGIGWKALTAIVRCWFGHDPVAIDQGHSVCRRCYRPVS